MEADSPFNRNIYISKVLKKLAKPAGKSAFLESKRLGLTITYAKKGIIFREFPDGSVVEVGKIETDNILPFIPRKSLVLHAKKQKSKNFCST